MAQILTSGDIEAFVVSNGNPEEIIMGQDDFSLAYQVYRQMNRDDKGAFILVMNTKIRPAVAAQKSVDLSEKTPLLDKVKELTAEATASANAAIGAASIPAPGGK